MLHGTAFFEHVISELLQDPSARLAAANRRVAKPGEVADHDERAPSSTEGHVEPPQIAGERQVGKPEATALALATGFPIDLPAAVALPAVFRRTHQRYDDAVALAALVAIH